MIINLGMYELLVCVLPQYLDLFCNSEVKIAMLSWDRDNKSNIEENT